MKYRYTLEVLTYDGRTLHRSIEADDYSIEEGVIKFAMVGGTTWNTFAIYPVDKTIITNIQKIK